jgi:DNA-binding response OmpR family regulator
VLRCGVEQGTADLLAKPFTAELLARRVRAVLDR